MSRALSRCGVCALLGERVADLLFGCTVPDDIDVDSASGQIVLEGIAKDKARCEVCQEKHHD